MKRTRALRVAHLLALAGAVLCGAAFQPASAATETTIYAFTGSPDGSSPAYGLVADPTDPKGTLYGTTMQGGAHFDGTIYQLTPPTKQNPSWQETVVYTFAGGTTGKWPTGPLVFDASGNAYGTAVSGGIATECRSSGCGVVFELTPPPRKKGAWHYKVIHSFKSALGSSPNGTLTFDKEGNLFGATLYGGDDNYCSGDAGGCGVLYELSPPTSGKKWKFKALYQMQHDVGAVPNGGLVFNPTETAFYGTAQGGGTNLLDGVVFEMTKNRKGNWDYSVIHNFLGQSSSDGSLPMSGVTLDSSGNIWGTTQYGGSSNCGNGCGVVFELASSGKTWTETFPHLFTGGSLDGRNPLGGLTYDGTVMYGATPNGGSNSDAGTVYTMTLTPSFAYSVLYAFPNNGGGIVPQNVTLLSNGEGTLYGTTSSGGASFDGTAFSLTTTAPRQH